MYLGILIWLGFSNISIIASAISCSVKAFDIFNNSLGLTSQPLCKFVSTKPGSIQVI